MADPQADPTRRFTGRVDAYARNRPCYPAGVLSILKERFGLTTDAVVADVGSGTGKLSELLLGNGNRVLGVEPNAEMRREAERVFAGEPRFTSIAGRAEQTTLADGSVDLVTAAQAFHWFDVPRARAELARILRAPRRVALVWNVRDESSSAFPRAYESFLLSHGTDYKPGVHGHADESAIAAFFAPARAHVASLPNVQVLDLEGLTGRVLSSSYMPSPENAGYDAMLEALRALFREHQEQGAVRLVYETRVYVGEVQSP